MSAARTIMIMAGGTGGHIFPGLAVAELLQAKGWKIVWLGSPAGMENKLVTPRGYTMAWINMSGVRGKGLLRALTLPLQLLIAFWQSARAILVHRPHVVLGMGGYVSFPGGMMNRQRPLLRLSHTAPTSRFSSESGIAYQPASALPPLYSTTRIRPSVSRQTKSG